VDVLIGLSAGSQAATVAASLTSLVSRLVLVSPTVDPAYRSMIKQLYVFVRGDPHDNSAFYQHVPDWARAGIPRIFRGFASAIALHLEDILPRVTADITICKVFDQLHRAEQPWSPLSVEEALRGLAATGLAVTT
jgi:pimeloyl-ACP methyl ester carboxylesterase